jgi:hypothetical protein
MLAQPQRPAFHWAYSEDIPGSRCGPEDGPWPRAYQILDDADIWRELRALAKPQTRVFNVEKGWRADMVNFQPAVGTRTQDRYVVKEIAIGNEKWSLTGVFDGRLHFFRSMISLLITFSFLFSSRAFGGRYGGARSTSFAYNYRRKAARCLQVGSSRLSSGPIIYLVPLLRRHHRLRQSHRRRRSGPLRRYGRPGQLF